MVVIKSWGNVFDKWRMKGYDLSFAAYKADEWEKRNARFTNRRADNDRAARDSDDHYDL